MFGPWAVDTRLSVDATRPLLNHGPESPGLGAPTTHTESPVLGALVANDAELVRLAGCTLVLPSGTSRSSTRSVVLSRPTTRAACAMPSDVVTVDLRGLADESLAREDLTRAADADAGPSARLVPVAGAHRDDRVRNGEHQRLTQCSGRSSVRRCPRDGSRRAGRAPRPRRARRRSGSHRRLPPRASPSTPDGSAPGGAGRRRRRASSLGCIHRRSSGSGSAPSGLPGWSSGGTSGRSSSSPHPTRTRNPSRRRHSSPIECNDGFCVRDRGRRGSSGPTGRASTGLPYTVRRALRPDRRDATGWRSPTPRSPSTSCTAWAATPSCGRGRHLRRHRARPRRGPRRCARDDVRGVRGARATRDARDRRGGARRGGPTSSASRCCTGSGGSQLSEPSVAVVGLRAAP